MFRFVSAEIFVYRRSFTIVSALRENEFSSLLVLIQPPEHRLEDEMLWKSKAIPADSYSSMLFFEAMCAELSPNEFGMQASNLRAIKYLDLVGADRKRHQNQNHLSLT
jgi:hypothetical protein